MGAAYIIFGKSVLPHQLALGTLGALVFAIIVPKGKKETPKYPPLNSSSPEEEKFIL